jgi:putative ABC transport system permease protein
MQQLKEILRRFLMLLHRDRFDRDLEEEMRLHLEQREQEQIEKGIAPEEAYYAVQRQFGNTLLMKERSRDMWGWTGVEQLIQDVRYGLRMLGKNPGFTITAVLALSLGIGANTAIFSVVNGVLLKPLPYKDPARLFVVSLYNEKTQEYFPLCDADFLDWRAQNQAFSDISAFSGTSYTLTGSGAPEQMRGDVVTADFFATLGVKPLLGRTFLPNEDKPGSSPMAVLAYDFWQSRFGADPAVIGRSIVLNGSSTTIIGVMPPHFLPSSEQELWTNLVIKPPQRRGPYYLMGQARLKPGVTKKQALADLTAIAHHIEAQNPLTNSHMAFRIIPLEEAIVGNVRKSLLVLLGAVAFVLLIASADVANLLMARAAVRQREIAVRSALGASRWRLVCQLLTESVLLAFFGGAIGLVFARWGVKILLALGASELPRVGEIGIDGRVMGFTCLISLVSGILFGLVPALQSGRSNVNEMLKEGGRGGTEGRRKSRLRGMLVVAEVALSVVLLIGAGLMLKSFYLLQDVNPGVDARNVLTARLDLADQKYRDDSRVKAFYHDVLEKVKALPGVEAAGLGMSMPPNLLEATDYFTIEGQAVTSERELGIADLVFSSPDYLRALGVPLLQGRFFNDGDREGAPNVAIVSENLARRYWPNQNPIGKRLKTGGPERPKNPWMEVVGVVGNVKYNGLEAAPDMALYEPYQQSSWSTMYLAIRTSYKLQDPTALALSVQAAVWSLDKDLPVAHVRTMDQLLSGSVQQPRFRMLLLGIFALVALSLATVGIYGVMAYSVSQRQHEIGIRMALGADCGAVLQLVVREGMALALAGVILGVAGALALTRFLSSLLFAVQPTDLATFVAIPVLLAGVAFLACLIPARKATSVDPMVALRWE